MTNAKAKFDKTISRCKEQIQLYERLKVVQEEHPEIDINVSQDILRGAIVLWKCLFLT